jgi:aminoglycoside 3-N-acetyltransferase
MGEHQVEPVAAVGETGAIEAADHPATTHSLVEDLRSLGVTGGMTLLVHASLSSIGYVAGGAQAVVEALVEAVGEEGTLVVPTHSSGLSEPSLWRNPPVPESWWQEIREATPAFDPLVTPTRLMGVVADTFRHYPGVRRSGHPQVSFAALGPNRDAVVGRHSLANPLGEQSPLARLYDVDGHILLLGVDHTNNTSLHLAEYRADYPGKIWVTQGAPVTVDGERRWVSFEDLDGEDDDFGELGVAFAESGAERRGPVGTGEARLMRAKDLVDFAVEWMTVHRAGRAGS